MNDDLVAFAMKTYDAHIAIVESNHRARHAHFLEAQEQVYSMIDSVRILDYSIKLRNGTFLHFCNAAKYEWIQGLRLDRIETTSSAVRMMPDWFLASRLKPGVTPAEGLSFHSEG